MDIRIRYSETDQMGVCYYSNFFVWFEMGRTEYFRALNLPYTLFEEQGLFLPVGEAHCHYHKPVRYDDIITVKAWISKMRRSSFHFSYTITKKDEATIVADGYTVHVFVNRSMKPQAIPETVRNVVEVVS